MTTTDVGAPLIDLTKVRTILAEISELVESLDGLDLDETTAVEGQSSGRARQERARKSQTLNLLASRLELAAQLTRVEYWYARGEPDPLNLSRRD